MRFSTRRHPSRQTAQRHRKTKTRRLHLQSLELRQLLAGDVFLQGDYLEIGFHGDGGYIGSDEVAPAEFNVADSKNLGIISDYEVNGWDRSTDDELNRSGDMVLPGSPVEGWGVEWNQGGSAKTFGNFGGISEIDIEGTSVDLSNGLLNTARWTGKAVDGPNELTIQQRISFRDKDLHATFAITLTNSGSNTLTDVEYLRNVDPDPEHDFVRTFTTDNSVPYAFDDFGVVQAEGTRSGAGLALAGRLNDPSDGMIVVSTEGFSNTDPDAILESPVAPSPDSPLRRDQAIAVAFRFPQLEPGESITFEFAYIGAPRAIDQLVTQWAADEGAFAVRGDDLFIRGTTASDTIAVYPFTGAGGGTRVDINGTSQVIPAVTGKIVVVGDSGSDHISISPQLTNETVIYGDEGNDTILGSSGVDEVYGGAGDDLIKTRGGIDVVYGDDGNDQIFGQGGGDFIFGGNGNDTISGGLQNDQIQGNFGTDFIDGDGGNDWLSGAAGIDVIYGGTGEDTLLGGNGNDQLFGESLNDVIFGGGGNDTIDGGAGADELYGEAGNDDLIGGLGPDLLSGGLGIDTADTNLSQGDVEVDVP